MKWNSKFNYPKSSRSIENGMRKYLFDDEKLPSVTSILQATKSDEDKATLANWVERVGKNEANRIKTEASTRGNNLHKYLEDYCRGRINESFFETIKQACDFNISPSFKILKLLALSVAPVLVISEIISAVPVNGATSVLPKLLTN